MARSARWPIPALTLVVVFGLGELHAHLIGHYPFTELPRFAWLCVFVVLIWVTTYAFGLPEEIDTVAEALTRSAAALLAAAGLVSVFALVVASPLLPRFVVFSCIVVLTPLCAAAALVSRSVRGQPGAATRVLVVAGEPEIRLLELDLHRGTERPAVLVAHALSEEVRGLEPGSMPLVKLAEAHRATLLVLDRLAQSDSGIVDQAAALHRNGLRVRTLSLFYDEWLAKVPLSELERLSLLFDIHELHHRGYPRMKRLLDVLLASAGLVLLGATVPLVALLDRAGNRGPLWYTQDRVGKGGRRFRILKFRTMPPGSSDSSWTTKDDPRVGFVGRMLRRTHLDELPQCVNVLRRELSVVGPRPEQPRYVEELIEKIPYYDIRHLVRPGMTGWAQVRYAYGSSEADALEKLQYDFYYLRHQSLALDLRIIGRTLRSVLARGGR